MASEFFDRTPMGLMDALCERLKKLLDSFWYPTESGEYHSPFVHAQYLPITKTADEEDDVSKNYPIVQVICTSGKITDFSIVPSGSEIVLSIYFGGYDDDASNQGWRIPMAMMWRTLQDLLSNTICQGYKLDVPVKWSPLGTDEPPYYQAYIETVWKGCPPAVEVPIEDQILIGTNNNAQDSKTDESSEK